VTTKAQLLRTMRMKCLECCCDQPSEVAACSSGYCPLWSLRFGKDPSPAKKGQDNLAAYRASKARSSHIDVDETHSAIGKNGAAAP
jgi:hypothetical protein